VNSNAFAPVEITDMIGVSEFKTKMHLKQTVVKHMEALLFDIIKITDVKSYYENLSPKYHYVETQGKKN
jgi:hypothetical protein